MAQIFGGPSRYIEDNKRRVLAKSVPFVVGIFMVSLFPLIMIVFGIKSIAINALAIVAIIVFSAISNVFINKAGLWQRGARGEARIKEELKKLPENYIVFADIQLKFGNADFVALGPTGIFAIEAKSHKGVITFDGKDLLRGGKLLEKNFIGQAKSNALHISRLIECGTGQKHFVIPIIVFADREAHARFGPNTVADTGVYIVEKGWLNKLILESRSVIRPEEANMIAECLSKR